VGALQDALGLDSGGTSQHLAALRRAHLVERRREGTSVLYRVADVQVFALLEAGQAIVTRAVEEQRLLLDEITAG
jgi:ArsR family transcriptional regulator